MNATKKFFKSEITGWKPFDIMWLSLATAVILGLSIYWKDNWISLTAALTGVWCVILTGKGKRSSFIFGLVNVIFYAIIAFEAKYYGEVMLNVLYYLPMNFVGWFAWKKHMNDKTGEVVKKRLKLKSIIILALRFLYNSTLTSTHDGKTIALTRRTFISKVMSLLFNMLPRFVIAFLPRIKHLLISWLRSWTILILSEYFIYLCY